jgi:hypothetical protein
MLMLIWLTRFNLYKFHKISNPSNNGHMSFVILVTIGY